MLRQLPRTALSWLSLPPPWAERWRRRIRQTTPADPQESKPAPAAALAGGLHLAPGAVFDELHAERILLGAGPMPAWAAAQSLERWQPPAGARPWGLKGWRIGHALDIPRAHRVPCALAVRGRLDVHSQCLIEGDLLTGNSLRLGPGCDVRGNLLSEGDMRIETGCSVHGLVMAEGKLLLSPGVVIGSPRQPVRVCADVIEVKGPVLVHGSVHARLQGAIALPPTLAMHGPEPPRKDAP